MKHRLIWIPAALIYMTLLAVASIGIAQEDTWTRKADMPTARLGASASVVGGEIYVIGGGVGFVALSPAPVEKYDPTTDTWIAKKNMPTPRIGLATSVVNKKIYAIGGASSWQTGGQALSAVEVYDPITDSWVKKADLPIPRSTLTASAVDGKIYVIGGWTGPIVTSSYLSQIDVYDPMLDSWEQRSNLPTLRNGFSAVVDEKIYVIGGWRPDQFFPTVEVYNPVTDTWAQKQDMPTPKNAFSASVVTGKIYVTGGTTAFVYGISPDVFEYNPPTDNWTQKRNMLESRSWQASSAVNGFIYVIGGDTTGGVGRSSAVEAYDTGVGIRVQVISPKTGLTDGGEQIAISFGGSFLPDAVVTLGGNPLIAPKVTGNLITGITPPGTVGEQDLRITSASAPMSDFFYRDRFVYITVAPPVVTEMAPTNGAQAGGEAGSITGSGFLDGITVLIGSNPAINVVPTPTLLTFTIPPGTEGAQDVIITNPGGEQVTLPRIYTYNPLPTIERVRGIVPDEGPLAGGTPVTITGANFMTGAVVMIGGVQVLQFDLFSPTELRLRTPAGTEGPKTVRVINPDGQEAVVEEGFTYNPAPTIVGVTPNMGPLGGGTRLTITGTGFLGRPNVIIGGAEADFRQVVRQSAREITVRGTPPSSAGVKDVVVINTDGQQAVLQNAFTYNPPPVINGVAPDSGKLSGGTKIIIRGSGFLDGAVVVIGDVRGGNFISPSDVVVVSAERITAVTPRFPGRPGPQRVLVRNPDGQEDVLENGFTYNPAPEIIEISPNYGPTSGSTTITIRGRGFQSGARVFIGEKPATTEVRNDVLIEAVTPPNPEGMLPVRVVNPDGQEGLKERGFETIGELAYNYPNPFRPSQGTTFRYVTNERVQEMIVRIFNLNGEPIDTVHGSGSSEVRWFNSDLRIGLYVYLMEVKLESGQTRAFKRMLEVE